MVDKHPNWAHDAEGFAGFWLRAVAYGIDTFILSVVILGIGVPIFFLLTVLAIVAWPLSMFIVLPPFFVCAIAISWFYFALQESSKFQATLGKRLVAIYVSDGEGQKISFSRASLRYFGKFISSMLLFFGFFLTAFTPRKQALHDLLADTLVVRR